MRPRRLPAIACFLGFWAATAASACAPEGDAPDELLGVAASAVTTGSPIVGVASGRCLDVKHASTAPGTPLQIYDCHGNANQRFGFTAAGELRGYDGAVCVEASSSGALPGGVAIAACNGQPAQQWKLDGQAIRSLSSGLCLDVKDASNANQQPVQLWTCHGGGNQRWTTTPSDHQAPTPPSGLALADLTCDAGTLSWNASTDDVGVAFYDVYHDGQLMKSVPGDTRTAALTLVQNASWGLYVNARDAAGNVSQASETLHINVPACQTDSQPPSTPGGLTAAASGTTVTLHWNASSDNVAVRAYDIFRDGAKVASVATTSSTPPDTSFVDSGLVVSTSYSYFVVARDAAGNVSGASNGASATTGQACANAVCSVTQVATDTDIPWGLVNLPDGTILYAQRDVHALVILDPHTGAKHGAGAVPNVESTDGEGGLLGLAIAPTFASDHWLYIMHTSPSDNRIVRVKLVNGAIDTSTEQVLVSGILRNKFHNGGRLRFGPDGKLYASTGDAQNGANAQNTGGLNGKVLRLNADGSVPSDNPFHNYVWSYGHRNPQGLAFDSQGRLWEQEFGNSVMDETNLIQRGGNYGWPDCEGTTSQGGGGCATAGFIAPKRTYSTAAGSCSGIAIVRDVLYVACERGTRMYRERIVLGGAGGVTDVTELFSGTYGRLRTVEPTPDGNLWLTTTNSGDKDSVPNNSDERIFRVVLGQ
jgi:glucose/arabinose dehydrogenase